MSAPAVEVRDGRPDDLPDLTELYNHYVRDTHATFDVDPLTVDQRRGWFEEHQHDERHRLLVAVRDGVIAGYATSSRLRDRAAYASSVETSVYLAPGQGGLGIGGRLYADLLAGLDAAGVHRCYAAIALPNEASEALHRRCGFTVVGTYEEVGRKHGRWIDVRWWQRVPGADATPPRPRARAHPDATLS